MLLIPGASSDDCVARAACLRGASKVVLVSGIMTRAHHAEGARPVALRRPQLMQEQAQAEVRRLAYPHEVAVAWWQPPLLLRRNARA